MNETYALARFHPSSFLFHPCFWWSELELNQPFGLFRPALIHLSYPTRDIADCQFSIADWSDNECYLSIGNWHSTIGNARQALRFRSLCTFSITARSSCASMNRYLRHSALASA